MSRPGLQPQPSRGAQPDLESPARPGGAQPDLEAPSQTCYPLPATRYPLLTRASLGLDRLRFAQRAKAVKLTVKRNTFAIKVRQPLG